MGKKKKEPKLSGLEKKMLDMVEEEMIDERNPDWRQVFIDGEPTNYAVSNVGDMVNVSTDRILKPTVTDQGYLVITLSHNGKHYTTKVHRLVAMAFIPNPENKPEVNHLDGNKQHNWYRNLEWATSAENKQHGIAMGLYDGTSFTKVGSDRPNAVYTDEQVHAVCKLLEQGKQPKEVADLVGVPVNLPTSIKYYGKWKHISSRYVIPKPGEVPRRRTGMTYNSSKYSHDLIRQICQLLEQGKGLTEISEMLGVHVGLPASIKSGRAWRSISKDYNIPKPKGLSDAPKRRAEIVELLTSGVTDYGEILRRLGLPDDRVNRKYIAFTKFKIQSKFQSPTTIENQGDGGKTAPFGE